MASVLNRHSEDAVASSARSFWDGAAAAQRHSGRVAFAA